MANQANELPFMQYKSESEKSEAKPPVEATDSSLWEIKKIAGVPPRLKIMRFFHILLFPSI